MAYSPSNENLQDHTIAEAGTPICGVTIYTRQDLGDYLVDRDAAALYYFTPMTPLA